MKRFGSQGCFAFLPSHAEHAAEICTVVSDLFLSADSFEFCKLDNLKKRKMSKRNILFELRSIAQQLVRSFAQRLFTVILGRRGFTKMAPFGRIKPRSSNPMAILFVVAQLVDRGYLTDT